MEKKEIIDNRKRNIKYKEEHEIIFTKENNISKLINRRNKNFNNLMNKL